MIPYKKRGSSLFTPEQKAIMRKPQYQILNQVKTQVEEKLAKWFLEEFELHGNQGMVLAREVVAKAVDAIQSKISASAPDVYFSEKDAIDWLFNDAIQLAEEMDTRDELEAILDEHQTREDKAKHGF